MAAYATYKYYTDTFLGTAIAEADFDALALRASEHIDRMTFHRAEDVTDEDDLDSLAMANCAVAEEIQLVNQEGSQGGIKSERVGAHSVEYAESNVKMLSVTARYENAARLYLENTEGNLLYKGFASGEYGSTLDED